MHIALIFILATKLHVDFSEMIKFRMPDKNWIQFRSAWLSPFFRLLLRFLYDCQEHYKNVHFLGIVFFRDDFLVGLTIPFDYV